MADFVRSTVVNAPADQLFDFLADVRNLPRYFDRMESAEPVAGDAVEVVADLPDGGEVTGEAWFRVDRERNMLRWGSEGDSDYNGQLVVSGDGSTSRIDLKLHTVDTGPPQDEQLVNDSLDETLRHIVTLVEKGKAPSK